MALAPPVPGSIVTQRFGVAVGPTYYLEPAGYFVPGVFYWVPFSGSSFNPHFHPGIDYSAAQGTPFLAMEDGTVTFAGYRNRVSGNVVEVEIRPGTSYGGGHFSRVLVKVGQAVKKGQKLAEIGSSGIASGPHSHTYVAIKGKRGDGVLRTYIYDPALFYPGGALANDTRVEPIDVPPLNLAILKGPGINIRTTPDLDVGKSNLYATSRQKGIDGWTLASGIWSPAGKQLHSNIYTGFIYRRKVANDDGAWVECYGFSRVLYIHADLVSIVIR